jgi:hypothetical protein
MTAGARVTPAQGTAGTRSSPRADSTDGGTERLPNAGSLARHEVAVTLRNRTFLIPARVVSGLRIQPTIGLQWAATDRIALAVDAQTVDNSGPGRQGAFFATRTLGPGVGSGNFLQELALGATVRLWSRRMGGLEADARASLSRGVRSYTFVDTLTGIGFGSNRREVVATLGADLRRRWSAFDGRVGMTWAALPGANALYLRQLPGATEDEFGTLMGPDVGITAEAASWLGLFVDAFAPVVGRNTIDRGTGRAARVTAYDVGATLHLGPALDVEGFLSNRLGNSGALALVADREYLALGTGVTFRLGGDRRAAARTVAVSRDPAPTMSVLLDARTTIDRTAIGVRGGAQGVLADAFVVPVDGLRLGAFLDYTSGTIDEAELGGTIYVRLVPQSARVPAAVGVQVSGSRSNNVFVNFLEGRRDEFARRGFEKGGFHFGAENETAGDVYLLTAALPVYRALGDEAGVWGAPVVAVAQRRGVQVAGVVVGATRAIGPSLWLRGDLGAPVGGYDNALTAAGRASRIPWSIGVAWRPALGLPSPPTIDLTVTNRVGASPFHSLRVRDRGRPALAAGVRVPLVSLR